MFDFFNQNITRITNDLFCCCKNKV